MLIILSFWVFNMEYKREILILLVFIAVGSVMYCVFAEISIILWNKTFYSPFIDPKTSPGLLYEICARLMLFGLFISGLSILLLAKKLEKLLM